MKKTLITFWYYIIQTKFSLRNLILIGSDLSLHEVLTRDIKRWITALSLQCHEDIFQNYSVLENWDSKFILSTILNNPDSIFIISLGWKKDTDVMDFFNSIPYKKRVILIVEKERVLEVEILQQQIHNKFYKVIGQFDEKLKETINSLLKDTAVKKQRIIGIQIEKFKSYLMHQLKSRTS